MNQRWSLNELYDSFESKEFQHDFQQIDALIKQLIDWTGKNLKNTNNAASKIEEYLKLTDAIAMVIGKLMQYASLTQSVEARNEQALMYTEKIRLKYSEMTQPNVAFEKWIGKIEDLDAVISSSKALQVFSFYLNEIKEGTKYTLSEAEEVIISKLKTTGSSAWNDLQNLLSSTLLVDITLNGVQKQLPITVVRNMAFDGDQTVRKTAYEAELRSYKKIEEASAASLNAIKGEVITLAKMRGYKSPLHMTLFNSRMDKETLEAMMTAIKESLPKFRQYFKKKAQLLGHENGLPFYDIFAPMGDAEMTFTYNEAHDFIVTHFSSFSKPLADMADKAFKNRWIDAEPREGKRGGAFCSNLYSIKQSRVLSNFNGKLKNVITLAHELGHAYHGECMFKEPYHNSHYPMPLAETASIFCETIVMNAVMKKASAKDMFALLESELADQGQTVVDIYGRYLFETELFERRAESALSVKDLHEMMLNAQKASYGDGLDPEYLHPNMWTNKPHYYYAERNFYNFPYTFGLLFAKGLYAIYQKRGEKFIAQYDKVLRATGKNNIADVAKIMDIDVHSVDFWRGSLDLIGKSIDTFVSMK